MPQVGDTVRYLNAVGGGVIVKIKDNIAYVDEDGFETPVLLRECVVVAQAKSNTEARNKTLSQPTAGADKNKAQSPGHEAHKTETERYPVNPAPLPLDKSESEETPYGDKINVVLGIETLDITHIGESGYEVSLVNDSNYYLYFCWMTKGDGQEKWTARYAGMVEPNIQVILCGLSREDVAMIEAMTVQLIAFKREKAFELRMPVSVEMKVDNTKFFKVHCFRDNQYFDNKVLAFEIVKDGIAVKASDNLKESARELEKALNSKRRADRPVRRPVTRRPKDKDEPLVVDLHIGELVDSTRGLSNADMLNLQIDTFRRIMDENLRNHGRKIVFIHGKGEGVLRQALYKELNYRYKGHDICDASFREYGYGATQVTIR